VQAKRCIRKVAAAIDRRKVRQAVYNWKDSVHNDKMSRIESRINELKSQAGNANQEIKALENNIENVRG
jgi:peptidoglycan hydrolase CwlO-like protein